MSYMGKNTSAKAKKIRQILNRKIFVPFLSWASLSSFSVSNKGEFSRASARKRSPNLCCSYWEFWQALTRTRSVEHASGLINNWNTILKKWNSIIYFLVSDQLLLKFPLRGEIFTSWLAPVGIVPGGLCSLAVGQGCGTPPGPRFLPSPWHGQHGRSPLKTAGHNLQWSKLIFISVWSEAYISVIDNINVCEVFKAEDVSL